jgi:hypothetical protein
MRFRRLGALENQDKSKSTYMEMSGEDHEKLQKMVIPP